MGSDERDCRIPSRRDFLKATGCGVIATSLAGCNGLQEEVEDGTPTATAAGGSPSPSPDDEGGGTGSGDLTAGLYGVDPELVAEGEEAELVRSTFSDVGYLPIEEPVPGDGDAGDRTLTRRVVTYGHEMAPPGESTDEPSTLNALSAGVLSTPATRPEGVEPDPAAAAPLTDLVTGAGGGLFTAAVGLGRNVEWLQPPVSVGTDEMQVLSGQARMETFVGTLVAEPGLGMPPADGGYLVTLHTARMRVGGDAVLFGMVNGWRRPPTMGPPREELGPETLELLANLYEDIMRVELFKRALGKYFRAAAAIPDEDERPPPPETESRHVSYATAYGLDEQSQVELGFPDEASHSDSVLNIFMEGRNVPSLFSLEEYDEDKHSRGRKYYLTVETEATAYRLGSDATFPFGVVASPLVTIEGEERNPLATDPLADVLRGFGGLWDQMRLLGASTDVNWKGGPSEFATLSGPQLVGRSGDVKGFEGIVAQLPQGGGATTRDDVEVFVGRVRTASEVVIAAAANVKSGNGYWDRRGAARELFELGMERVVRGPGSASGWVDPSIDDLNLVQIVSNTRLERASGDTLRQSDPPLVEGRNTAPVFDLSTFSGTRFSGYNPAHAVFTFDIAGRSGSNPWMTLDGSSLGALDQGSTDPDALFHRKARGDSDPDNDLPVFELDGSHSSVTLTAHAPSGHTYDTRSVRKGTDYSTAGQRFLRVGFITVTDPDDGSNYGDGNGRPTSYVDTVDAAFEYLRRTYPSGISAYRHDGAIVGNNSEDRDYKHARIALERIAKPGNTNWSYSGTTMAHGHSTSSARNGIRQNGFDVWVLIAPDGYYAFHRGSPPPSGLAPGNDRLAVGATEGDGRGWFAHAAETTAQEIGHRLGTDQYRNPTSGAGMSNPLSQRDDGGTDQGDRDFDHARHLSSNNGTGSTDGPGLVSRAYSLATGTFGVPNTHSYSGSYSINGPPSTRWGSYGPTGSANRIGRVESFMSYSGRDLWADSVIIKDILNSGFNRDAKNYRTSTLFASGDTAGDESGDTAGDAGVTLTDVQVFDGWLYETDEERLDEGSEPVTVTLFDPDGTRIERTRATTGIPVDGDEVNDGDLGTAVVFDIDFRMETAEMVVEQGGVETRVNPLTRPIRDAFDRLTDAGFAGSPAAAREEADEVLTAVDDRMQAGDYAAAHDRLAEYAETELPGVVDPEYQPFANEPGQGRLRALVERMLVRLDGLADIAGPSDGAEERTVTLELPDGTERQVAPVESDGPVADYYGFDAAGDRSSNTPDGLETDGATVTFLHRDTSTGDLSLVAIHGDPEVASEEGGTAILRFEGASGARWLVQDGPPDNDAYETPEGTFDGSESASWSWPGDRSDGGAIGTLAGTFEVRVTHRVEAVVNDRGRQRTGVDAWLFVDGSDVANPIELATFGDDTGDVSIGLFDSG